MLKIISNNKTKIILLLSLTDINKFPIGYIMLLNWTERSMKSLLDQIHLLPTQNWPTLRSTTLSLIHRWKRFLWQIVT